MIIFTYVDIYTIIDVALVEICLLQKHSTYVFGFIKCLINIFFFRYYKKFLSNKRALLRETEV